MPILHASHAAQCIVPAIVDSRSHPISALWPVETRAARGPGTKNGVGHGSLLRRRRIRYEGADLDAHRGQRVAACRGDLAAGVACPRDSQRNGSHRERRCTSAAHRPGQLKALDASWLERSRRPTLYVWRTLKAAPEQDPMQSPASCGRLMAETHAASWTMAHLRHLRLFRHSADIRQLNCADNFFLLNEKREIRREFLEQDIRSYTAMLRQRNCAQFF